MINLMDKTIFYQEQEHLSVIYGKLQNIKKDLEDQIETLNATAEEEKNDIRDNLRFDTADDEVKTEMYGEIETWNRYIDSYNVKSSILTSRLNAANLLLKSPYFARIRLQFAPGEEPEDFYIGSTAMSEGAANPLIIDWRSPIAETYYNQQTGSTYYTVDGRKIPVDLQLRRQFDIEKDTLKAYFDTTIAIEDPMLIRSLMQQRTDKMQAITVTIQREQNAVIRHPDAPAILVSGIAGSGKTSVLLQRIAYLFYRQRRTLRPDQVYLLTLNPVFRSYIDNVLPDMGESNPATMTYQEFLDYLHVPVRGESHDPAEADHLRRLEEVLPTLQPKPEYFIGISQKDKKILSASQVADVLKRHIDHIPMGVRLIQIAEDELKEETSAALRRRRRMEADSEGISEQELARERREEMEALSEEEQNQMINDYGGAFRQIEEFGWIDYERIGREILGTKHLTPLEWIYLKMLLTGECDREARYVMIDEVQDYTKAQLMVLLRYFPKARFMMLGDEFQSILDGRVSFSEIEQLFGNAGLPVTEMQLMTSYRSSPEITDLFTSLLPHRIRVQTSSVQRPGTAPIIETAADDEEYREKIRTLMQEFEGREHQGITALICKNRRSIGHIREVMGDEMPHEVQKDQRLPKEGLVLMELSMVKGLEFDSVIVLDADAARFPDDTLSRHRLYTMMSRATKNLAVLAEGELTPLLRK